MKLRVLITLVLVIIPILLIGPGLISGSRPPTAKYLRPLEVAALNSGIAGIDSIYCINLDVRKEKWEAVKQQLSRQNLLANRVPAINGWTELTKYDRRKLRAKDKGLGPGRIGCFLSHLSVLKNAADRGFDRILVLEDDAEFTAPMQEVSGYVEKLTKHDPDWDILYLDNWSMETRGLTQRFERSDSTMLEIIMKPKEALLSSNFFRTYYRHDLHGYVVSKKGIQKLLNHFMKRPFQLAIDVEMNHIDEIRMYETGKAFVKADYSISDTSTRPE
jgi:GR25 family glycosyltransferase involved in LPS biosynthesis